MSSSTSTCHSQRTRRGVAFAFAFAFASMLFDAHEARAQACCAGAAAVSPGRLMLHETALIGARLRAATSLGSYDARASFHGNPSGSNEFDFEQAVFGSLRFLRRGQAGAVLPLLESWRRSESTGAEFGSGLG